jgi:hypothetical protein
LVQGARLPYWLRHRRVAREAANAPVATGIHRSLEKRPNIGFRLVVLITSGQTFDPLSLIGRRLFFGLPPEGKMTVSRPISAGVEIANSISADVLFVGRMKSKQVMPRLLLLLR